MSLGRAGLPGWRSPPGAGGWAGMMPGDAGIRQQGFQAAAGPGLATARVLPPPARLLP